MTLRVGEEHLLETKGLFVCCVWRIPVLSKVRCGLFFFCCNDQILVFLHLYMGIGDDEESKNDKSAPFRLGLSNQA